MARSADALRRETVTQQAQGVGARIQAPSTNAALQLAQSLGSIEPSANQALQTYAANKNKEATLQAKHDALVASGAKLADAVRDGTLEPTSNPWYVQAYQRESAAVRGQSSLAQLQLDSASWAEKNDPEAFATRWRAEVGKAAEGFNSKDETAGFAPVEAQFTQQALQSNVSQNVTRITAERKQNLSALASSALAKAIQDGGGSISANTAVAALNPARLQYLATGGSLAEWNEMAVGAVTSAAYATQNSGALDLLHAPELVHGESEGGAAATYGDGASGSSAPPLPILPIAPVASADLTPNPAGRIPFPIRSTGFRVSSAFGEVRGAERHNGLDLAVPVGTPVFSPGSGRVVEVGSDKRSGNYVKVDLGGGLVTSFAHLSETSVKKGDTVGKDTQLALSGGAKGAPGAGDSRGPHVHWVTRLDGKPVDPRSAHFQDGGAQAQVAPVTSQVASVQAQDTPALAAPPEAVSPTATVRGASLYDMTGVADKVEADRYRITQARETAQTERLRAITMQAKVEGAQGYNELYATHGTDLLTGAVPSSQIVAEMSHAGYKPQAIAQALSLVRGDLQDNAGVATARLALHGADPSTAKRVMDLQVRATRDGLTPGLEEEVGGLVLDGTISGDDGTRIITSGIAAARRNVENNRQDATYAQTQADRAEAATAKAKGYKVLKQTASDITGLVATRLTTHNIPVSPKARAAMSRQITDAAGAWLAIHPGDFAGAEVAARQAAVALVRKAAAARGGQAPTAPAKPGATNARRTN